MAQRLDLVIATNPGGFVPEHPDRPPWHQRKALAVDHASTGNVAVVNWRKADRADLHGLDQPSWDQDWEFPEDWTRQSWGVG